MQMINYLITSWLILLLLMSSSFVFFFYIKNWISQQKGTEIMLRSNMTMKNTYPLTCSDNKRPLSLILMGRISTCLSWI